MNPLYIYIDLHNALSSECSAHLRDGSQNPPACEKEAERFDRSSARALKFPLKQTPMSSQTCWASPCVLGLSRPPGSPVNTLIWEDIVRYVAAAFLYVLICIMARKWIRSSNWTIVRDINHTCIHKLTAHVDLAETETFCCLEKQTFSLTGP